MGMPMDEMMKKRAEHVPHSFPINHADAEDASADAPRQAVAAADAGRWRWLAGAAAIAGYLFATAKR